MTRPETTKGGRRPRKPASKFRGVEIRWSATRGWCARARRKDLGRVAVGPLRDTQEQAYDDYRGLCTTARPRSSSTATLGEGVRRAIAAARARGLPDSTVNVQYVGHAKFLYRKWPETTPLREIDAPAVVAMITAAQRQGRSDNTLLQKDLPLLRQCFEAVGMASPVDAARKLCGKNLRHRRPQMAFFTGEELGELLGRMRAREITAPNGKRRHVARAAWHADLVHLLAFTGLRLGELERVSLADVSLKRGSISVVTAKDKSNPRDCQITARLVEVVERLVADARRRAKAGAVLKDIRLVPGAMKALPPVFARWQRILGEPRLCGRTLRHTFATGLLASGANPIDVMELCGHRRLETTNKYVHAVSPRKGQVLADWETSALGPSASGAAAPGTVPVPPPAAPADDPAS